MHTMSPDLSLHAHEIVHDGGILWFNTARKKSLESLYLAPVHRSCCILDWLLILFSLFCFPCCFKQGYGLLVHSCTDTMSSGQNLHAHEIVHDGGNVWFNKARNKLLESECLASMHESYYIGDLLVILFPLLFVCLCLKQHDWLLVHTCVHTISPEQNIHAHDVVRDGGILWFNKARNKLLDSQCLTPMHRSCCIIDWLLILFSPFFLCCCLKQHYWLLVHMRVHTISPEQNVHGVVSGGGNSWFNETRNKLLDSVCLAPMHTPCCILDSLEIFPCFVLAAPLNRIIHYWPTRSHRSKTSMHTCCKWRRQFLI